MRVIYFIFFSTILIIGCSNINSFKQNKNQQDLSKYKTLENLKSIINLESTASKKYLEFSNKAEKEGHGYISKLFLAISKSDAANSMIYYQVLYNSEIRFNSIIYSFKVNSTKENIENAIENNNSEISKALSEFVRISEDEKLFNIHGMFSWTDEIEKKQVKLLENAHKCLTSGKELLLPVQYYICPKCGNIYFPGTLPIYCELCMTNKVNFIFLM